ncbi:MAG: hypothetical protein DIU78_009860 [Pseudomonadota bacterium]
MIWRFSDGTTVELGGNVEGDTYFAQRLRAELPERATVSIWPLPSDAVPFDRSDPALLDAMLTHFARSEGVRIVQRPEGIPPLPAPPWTAPAEAGVIY